MLVLTRYFWLSFVSHGIPSQSLLNIYALNLCLVSFSIKDGGMWNTNKFTDISQFPMGPSSDTLIWERRLLYCVPVSSYIVFIVHTHQLNCIASGCKT